MPPRRSKTTGKTSADEQRQARARRATARNRARAQEEVAARSAVSRGGQRGRIGRGRARGQRGRGRGRGRGRAVPREVPRPDIEQPEPEAQEELPETSEEKFIRLGQELWDEKYNANDIDFIAGHDSELGRLWVRRMNEERFNMDLWRWVRGRDTRRDPRGPTIATRFARIMNTVTEGTVWDTAIATIPDAPPVPEDVDAKGVCKEPLNYWARRTRGVDPLREMLTDLTYFIAQTEAFDNHAGGTREKIESPKFNIWRFADRLYHQTHGCINFFDANRGLLINNNRARDSPIRELHYSPQLPGNDGFIFFDMGDFFGIPPDYTHAQDEQEREGLRKKRGMIYRTFLRNVSGGDEGEQKIFPDVNDHSISVVFPPDGFEGTWYYSSPEFGVDIKVNRVFKVWEMKLNVLSTQQHQRYRGSVDFETLFQMLHAGFHEFFHDVVHLDEEADRASMYWDWYHRRADGGLEEFRDEVRRTYVQVILEGRVGDSDDGREDATYHRFEDEDPVELRARRALSPNPNQFSLIAAHRSLHGNMAIRTQSVRIADFWFLDIMQAVGQYLNSDAKFYPQRITWRFVVPLDGTTRELARRKRNRDYKEETKARGRYHVKRSRQPFPAGREQLGVDDLMPGEPLFDYSDQPVYGMPKRKRDKDDVGGEIRKKKTPAEKSLEMKHKATRIRLKQAVKDPVITFECDDYSCFVRALIIDDLHQESFENGHDIEHPSFRLLHHYLSEEGKDDFTREAKDVSIQLGLEFGKPVTDDDIKNAATIRSKRIRVVDADTCTLLFITPYLDEYGREVEEEYGLPCDNDVPHNRLCFSKDSKNPNYRHMGVIKRPGAFDVHSRAFCTRCRSNIKNNGHQCKKACPGCLYYECKDFRVNKLSKKQAPPTSSLPVCSSCNRRMQGQECMEQHILNGTCAKWWQCPQCPSGSKRHGTRLARYNEETCPEGSMPAWEYDLLTGDGSSDIPISARHVHNCASCSHCNQPMPEGEAFHTCYIQSPAEDSLGLVPDDRWFVADFESSAHTEDGHHEANALMIRRGDGKEYLVYNDGESVIKTFVDMIEKKAFIDKKPRKTRRKSKSPKKRRSSNFIDDEADDSDETAQEEEQVHEEEVKVEEKKKKKEKTKRIPLTFIFHNASKYDTNLIMREVYFRSRLQIKNPIFSGRKILRVVIGTGHVSSNGDIRIIDSYAFLPASLRSLAKDWIPPEEGKALIRKGWFPHKFNELKTERHAYEGSIPGLDQFFESWEDDLEFYFWWLKMKMSSTAKVADLKGVSESMFALPTHLPMCEFRDDWGSPGTNKLRGNPICVDQVFGESKEPIDDLHKQHFSQVIDKDPVGLALMTELKTYFEFKTYVATTTNVDNKYFKETWSFKNNFITYLKQDVNVLYHVFNNFRAQGLKLAKLFPVSKQPIDPLHFFTLAAWANAVYRSGFMPVSTIARSSRKEADILRQWMFGARTENFALLFEAVQGENKAYSFDVSSMYPFCQSRRPFPEYRHIRLPKPTLDFMYQLIDEKKLFLAQVMVECPKQCHIPVLPRRSYIKNMEGQDTKQYKLLFDLVDGERFATSVEIVKALEAGYRVTELKLLIYWESSSTEIFSSYMNLFYLLKTAAGGWPKIIDEMPPEKQEEMKGMSMDAKKAVAREYFNAKSSTRIEDIEAQGCLDDTAKPAQRAMDKLLLNSNWGKLAQKDDMPHLAFLRTDVDKDLKSWRSLHSKLERGEIKDLEFHGICDDISLGLRVHWLDDAEYLHEHGDVARSAVQMGIFTTAHARVHLYECLLAVSNVYGPERLLYCDTDSCSFWLRKDEKVPFVTGSRLGEWQDETKGDYIVRGMYGGPKQKITITEKGVVKHVIRGFNCHAKGVRRVITAENFAELVKRSIPQDEVINDDHKVDKEGVSSLEVKQKTIKRCDDGSMYNIDMTKAYAVRQSKRKPKDIERVDSNDPLLCSTLPFGFVEL